MNTELSLSQYEEVRAAFEQISGLPLGVHVTDVKGRFLFANAEACTMFGLSEDLSQYNIDDFYNDLREQRFVLRELKKGTPGQWRKGFMALIFIQGESVKVRFSSKPFFDEIGEVFAILNVVENISRVEWYADLEDELEVGLFAIDRYLKIADCNQFLAEMLGYENTKNLIGKSVAWFMWEPETANELLKALLERPKLRKVPMKLKRRDGAMVLVEMSCDASSLEDGEISRVRGVIKDVTFKVFYDDLPVGLFLISSNRLGEDIISHVNLTFAKIYGFDRVSEVLGKSADIFQANPMGYVNYKAALNRAAEENRPLLDYYMEIKDKEGKTRNVVLNVRFLPRQKGQIRVGALYDLTDHVGKHVRTLEEDFSALLHTYLANMNGLRDTISSVIKAQGLDIIKENYDIDSEKADSEIIGHRKHLESLLRELEEIAEVRNVGVQQIEMMQKFLTKTTGVNENIQGEKENSAWLRRCLIEMRKPLDVLKKVGLPRESIRNIRFEINEMLRLTNVVSLSILIDELNERIPEFYYFRDYLSRKETEMQDVKTQNVVSILMDSIQFLESLATIKGVAIMHHINSKENIPVLCNKTSLNRAFYCLLHNAIKYSWHKSGDTRSWVDVRVEKRQESVEIIIENWGVPIRKEELENDMILQFGKRGLEADDHGRSGTGIGLYDALTIIKKHGGMLKITSEPTLGNPPDLYSKPFITKAHITLPIFKQS